MTAAIVGWAHTPFGKLIGETVESLIVRVVGEALADAGISPKDVDEIVLGHFNAGFSAQDFTASLVLQASPISLPKGVWAQPTMAAVIDVSFAELWSHYSAMNGESPYNELGGGRLCLSSKA